MEEDSWITVQQAATIRQCSDRTILRLISEKKVEAKRDGKRYLILKSSLIEDKQGTNGSHESELVSALKAQLQGTEAELQEKNDQIR